MICRTIFVLLASSGTFISANVEKNEKFQQNFIDDLENDDPLLPPEPSIKNRDKSKWVDPMDMINFDFHTNEMKRKSEESAESRQKENLSHETNQALAPLSHETTSVSTDDRKICASHEAIVGHFKQILRKLFIKKLKLNLIKDSILTKDIVDAQHYFDATISVSNAQLKFLARFLEDEQQTISNGEIRRIYDAMEILPEIFEKVEKRTAQKSDWFHRFTNEELRNLLPLLNIFALILFAIFLLSRLITLSHAKLFLLSILTIFLISVVWNWNYLYKMKYAELRAKHYSTDRKDCVKTGTESSGGFFRTPFALLRGFFLMPEPDKCVEYQKSLLIDPFWEVTPMHAVAMTLTDTVFSPMKLIGENFAKFYTALLKDLPPIVWCIILPSTIFVLLVLMFFICGYRFSVLYGFIRFEPTDHSGTMIANAFRGSSPPLSLSDADLISGKSEANSDVKRLTRSSSTSRLR